MNERNVSIFFLGVFVTIAIFGIATSAVSFFKKETPKQSIEVGKCYRGGLGHFKKTTYTQKVLKIDDTHVLSGQCNETECRGEGRNSEEDSIEMFKYLYPTEVKCP